MNTQTTTTRAAHRADHAYANQPGFAPKAPTWQQVSRCRRPAPKARTVSDVLAQLLSFAGA